MFPDANNSIEATRCKEDKLSECCFKEAGVQTDISGVDMQLPLPLSLEESSFLVCAKAFSSGIRIEREVPVLIDKANFKTGIYRWDISRAQSRGHQVIVIIYKNNYSAVSSAAGLTLLQKIYFLDLLKVIRLFFHQTLSMHYSMSIDLFLLALLTKESFLHCPQQFLRNHKLQIMSQGENMQMLPIFCSKECHT